jgi:glycine hydroxymethyltransferase
MRKLWWKPFFLFVNSGTLPSTMKNLGQTDSEIYNLIRSEEHRQLEGLEMIASENYVSAAVREAVGSVLENKYAEGYPGRRYYTGNEFVDEIERLTRERAKKLFGVPHVNVQPHSGSEANLEIFGALAKPEDLVLSQLLSHGGHLSMGQEASFTSKYYKSEYYHMTEQGEVNFEELDELAKKFKPRIIWSGGTGYTKVFKWDKYAEIADSVGAYFVADISHIAGLVVGGAHPSPAAFADVIMTTTHKTLRGPRGALIMVTEKGLAKDRELPKKVDFSVFPGHQGGPHINRIAGIAVALKEAAADEFRGYAKQVVANAGTLAAELRGYGFDLVGGGSENHMIWIDLRGKGLEGWHAHVGLETVNVYGNKQTIPNDPKSAFYPSGYRIGTPAITTRGMKESDMIQVARFINEGVETFRRLNVSGIGGDDKERDQSARKEFKMRLGKDAGLVSLKNRVVEFAKGFPVP